MEESDEEPSIVLRPQASSSSSTSPEHLISDGSEKINELINELRVSVILCVQ